ncbi:hypothetical protein [Fusobacterium necrophorum]|uniref:Uncharacterized protein n=2 Tax=Fusobacterium necrophorum TaxID=859 RepID=A0AAN4ATS8_9FUSO|nr:hypothetical protein [Fusobacterium necrophorum]AYV94723.1 hypothetical protein BWX37_03420 [Fusobacterium necrophorum subsp. funduliforme]EJU18788.1 hypothetical protein HMPREF1127_1048 [Fusobacterium necrophorum subsp. funduliforme Fnf 1007]KYL02968.1 hypothetical protein A2J06_09925 [Fusobacterium necrophorum subsp. funduliforme]KYM37702.1 hypothetical protein A2U03_10820 [Fusobacterium necrophorum subsp. funduliforme]KYM52213.1 hypothetical protein A2U04_10360 [Fusobacterium necrophorum
MIELASEKYRIISIKRTESEIWRVLIPGDILEIKTTITRTKRMDGNQSAMQMKIYANGVYMGNCSATRTYNALQKIKLEKI